jgi:hypothetical protein
MIPLGVARYIVLRIVSSAEVAFPGLVFSQIQTAFFRNNLLCTDALTFTEWGGGYYFISYTPTAAGSDYFAVYYPAANYLLETRETVVDLANMFSTGNAVSVTQNTGGSGALLPVITNTASYTLYLYNSSDWLSGNTDTSQAAGSTALDASGNWLQSPVTVLHGTYHFVLRNNAGVVVVFRANVVI